MGQVIKFMAVAFLVVLRFASASHSSEYQGFGAETPGGSGQPMYRVTNLSDSGPGSLRDAVSRGNRHIVFDVGGEINLSSRIHVKGSYITIDGFTAPAPGITLKGWGLYMWGKDGAHNIIIRGIRVRNSGGDGLHVSKGAHDIVIDRSSVALAGDGNIDITEGAYNVTVSRTILAAPAAGNKNMLIMYDSPQRITLHHNLFMNAESRSPQVQTDGFGTPATDTTVDMRNNVIWDWRGGYGTRLRYGPRVNVINNFYAANGGDARDALIVCPGPECDDSNPASAARVYAKGNISADGINLDANGNESAPFPAAHVDTQDALAAACVVVAEAGVRPFDAVDQQHLSEISLPPCPDLSTLPSSDGATDSADAPTDVQSQAVFLGVDTTTRGNWQGTYGKEGFILVNYNGSGRDVSSLPAYLRSYSYSGNKNFWVWNNNTSDSRALAPLSGSRVAATAYSGSSFSLTLSATDASPHTLSLYFVDWDTTSRQQVITIFDANTNVQLDQRSLAKFQGGIYLNYEVEGSVRVEFTRTGDWNSVLSAVFWR